MRRCYVDLMARLKVTAYTQRQIVDSEGVRQVLNDPHTALKYDFAMVRDENPMGEAWLKYKSHQVLGPPLVATGSA